MVSSEIRTRPFRTPPINLKTPTICKRFYNHCRKKKTAILQHSLIFTPSDNKTLIRDRCPVESTNAKRDACQLITTAQKAIQTDRLHAIEKLIIVETKDFTIPSVPLKAQHKPTQNVSTTHTAQHTHPIPHLQYQPSTKFITRLLTINMQMERISPQPKPQRN